MRPSEFDRRVLAAAIHRTLPDSSSLRALIGVAALGLACHAPAASATTYVVDTVNDTTTAGKTTLRQAIFEANGSANNIVQFDPSLNGSTITLSMGEIAVSQPMYILGPGADKLTISGNDASRIFNVTAPTSTPIIFKVSGLTLTHGKCGPCGGGAIYAKNVSLTVQNAVLDYNAAGFGGSAIFSNNYDNSTAVTELSGATITKNTSATSGAAGIYFNYGASLDIADSVIDSNTAADSGGGGFMWYVPLVTIERSQISGNKALTGLGGGLFLRHTAAQISNSTISGNTAGDNGGGLVFINGSFTLTGDTISGNSGSNGGGIFIDDTQGTVSTNLLMEQSTVSGNTATSYGGGIDAPIVHSISVTRSLISGNSVYDPAAGGGGIAIGYAVTRSYLKNSTFYANYAYANGAGVGIFNAADQTTFDGATIANNFTFGSTSNGILCAGSTAINNSIVANNFAGHFGITQDLDGSGSIFENYSLIRTVGTASISTIKGNLNGQDPLLGPLAVNGGPTLTMMPALAPNKSPALDSGQTTPPPTGTDQRGLPRSANGQRDMGAVERQYPEDIIFRSGVDLLQPG